MSGRLSSEDIVERRWSRNPAELIWEQGIGEGVVFDAVSGETHFLSDLPALILSVVDDEPLRVEQLVERFAGPVDLDQSAQSQIVAALLFLEGAELVESQAV